LNIGQVYSGIDINLLISAEEGFGRTIIEAGYYGVPSIGTRIGGIPEVIENERTGYLVELDDVEQLSSAILRLATDREKRQQMGAAARELVREKFLLPAHCRKIEEIYQQLLRNHNS
ncbi:MAG: glycosyltransferase family 4 protein, partial [Candidatus Sumerlaeia bacterium]|nr:glycosyltransferase family 4 protein [Candidatus Sumerlaeia bacterium]